MEKSIRDIVMESLPFLPEEERAQVIKVRDKYVSVIGNKAHKQVYDIVMSGLCWAKREGADSMKAVASLTRKMDEFYRDNVDSARVGRERKAELLLAFIQDRLNMQLSPTYRSLFDERDYFGTREIGN
jgi:hypothetical protein